jgi:hypothetical protein
MDEEPGATVVSYPEPVTVTTEVLVEDHVIVVEGLYGPYKT